MLLYWAFLFGKTVTRAMPLRVSYGIARGIGIATFYLWPGGRRRCIQNMRHVTGGDLRAARRLARASFAAYLAYLVDFFRVLGAPREEIRARIHGEGWRRIDEARHGRGVIIVTIHYGLWDLGAAALAVHGVPIAAIADRFPSQHVNDFIVASREHLGMRVIPADRMGPGILRALRQDEAVAILADIPTPGEGVRVTFFGDTIEVPDTAARLALRTGAGIVAATVPRITRWDDAVSGEAVEIDIERTGDEAADAGMLMQALFAQFERVIRRDPAQWYAFRNLWPGDANDHADATTVATR